jgi:hypothetical protein
MPNRRGTPIEPHDIETANPWSKDRWAQPEPQDRRGAPGSRGLNDPVRRRETHSPEEWGGVNPLGPILPAMPQLKPGDQGG